MILKSKVRITASRHYFLFRPHTIFDLSPVHERTYRDCFKWSTQRFTQVSSLTEDALKERIRAVWKIATSVNVKLVWWRHWATLTAFGSVSRERVEKRLGVQDKSQLLIIFILYINDLPNSVNICESLLFADDTSIFCSHTDIEHLTSVLNQCFNCFIIA